jgi:hypothetical protein
MTPSHWQKLKTILADALECSSDAERERVIATACEPGTALAADVASFLRYAGDEGEDWLMRHSPLAPPDCDRR